MTIRQLAWRPYKGAGEPGRPSTKRGAKGRSAWPFAGRASGSRQGSKRSSWTSIARSCSIAASTAFAVTSRGIPARTSSIAQSNLSRPDGARLSPHSFFDVWARLCMSRGRSRRQRNLSSRNRSLITTPSAASPTRRASTTASSRSHFSSVVARSNHEGIPTSRGAGSGPVGSPSVADLQQVTNGATRRGPALGVHRGLLRRG